MMLCYAIPCSLVLTQRNKIMIQKIERKSSGLAGVASCKKIGLSSDAERETLSRASTCSWQRWMMNISME